ncbi:MAG: hypothetical protein KJ025_06960 [Burkholderiales bacterium]|nr:hypothetical protein [Burkholderiales bacterium]
MQVLRAALAGLVFAVAGAAAADARHDAEILAFESCSTPAHAPAPAKGPYRGIGIATLLEGDSVEEDRGVVWFKVRLDPYLLDGHALVVAFNGKLLPMTSTALEFSLPAVALGKHTIQARVVDTEGNTIITSRQVEFTVREPWWTQPPLPGLL